jgi:uncharacterized protein (UPF0333 family)
MDLRHHRGQAFLALVFLIGTIVVIVAVLVAFFANSFVDTGYGLSASASAEAAATSGAQDAMLQLDRNASFVSAGYPVAAGNSTATVTVTQGAPSAGYVTILSTASVANHVKKIQVILYENASTTQMSTVSWTDVQ